MRKRPDLLWLVTLVVISILLLSNLTTKGIYSSHDGEIHIARIAQVGEALKHQSPPIRWLSNFNFGFGYPTFVYAYSLPYYFSSLLAVATRDPEITFKLLILLSVVFSAVTFYYFVKLTFSRPAAFVGSLFYISAPYRFADIYERGALGEVLSFMISPLLFMSPYILSRNIYLGFITTALVVATFIGTHAITFIIFLSTTVAISPLVFKKNLKLYIYFGIAVLLGFLLSAFQWIPMIFEQKYINLDSTYFNIFEGTFISVNQLLRIPAADINTGTGIQLGTAQILTLGATLIAISWQLIKKKAVDFYVVFFLVTAVIAAILTLDLSKIIWTTFGPLQTVLFPWRFLTLTTFACAFLAAALASSLTRKSINFVALPILIFIAVFPSRHFLKGHNWHTFDNNFYQSYPDSLKLDNYYLPMELKVNLQELQLEPVSVVDGEGMASLLSKQNNLIIAQVAASQESKVQFHTIYFPGWMLTIDGQRSEIIKDFPSLEGIIVARLPKGNHIATLKFEETPLRRAANLLSLFGLMILVAVVFARAYLAQLSRKVKQVL